MLRQLAVATFLAAVCIVGHAQPKPCDELRDEIEAKIRANGVPRFTLDIVPISAAVQKGKVVGTCGGGTQKILYWKTQSN